MYYTRENDCYKYQTTEAMNFADFQSLYTYIKEKLQFESGDKLMLVTCKIKMPMQYWLESVSDEARVKYIARELSEYIIKQINERMNKQNDPFRDMSLLKIIDKRVCYGRDEHVLYNTLYFYDVINIKNYTMDDIKQNVGEVRLGKNKNFKIAYESATGQEGKYTKPFNKYVYFEIPENSEEFLSKFIENNQFSYVYHNETNVFYDHGGPDGIFFGNCKFNTVRKDYSIFKARMNSEDTAWIEITTKAEIESSNRKIKYELEHPVVYESITADELIDML